MLLSSDLKSFNTSLQIHDLQPTTFRENIGSSFPKSITDSPAVPPLNTHTFSSSTPQFYSPPLPSQTHNTTEYPAYLHTSPPSTLYLSSASLLFPRIKSTHPPTIYGKVPRSGGMFLVLDILPSGCVHIHRLVPAA